MPPTAVALTQTLRQLALLLPEEQAELPALETRFPDPVKLAAELQRRGWLTTYQINQLLRGEGEQLVLGSYVLLEKLGEGGMGAVFKARHRSLGRVAALKLIRKDRLTHPAIVQRFQREVRAVAQLSHPNVIMAYDADQVADVHFLVMEYVEGIDLGKLVQQRGPLPVSEACDFIRQAALGLQQAHERGLVHRDIKPANLLRTHRDGTIKLLDLGLVRLLQHEGSESATSVLTQEGLVMGTLDFMAPEQVRNAHNADIRADIYSLGCTLFFLLTGRAPFAGRNATEKMYGHCFREPPSVQSLRPEVPGEVSALVFKLMSKSPDDRCQTPAELANLLGAMPATAAVSTGRATDPPMPEASTGTTPPWVPQLETDEGRAVAARRRTRRRPALWLALITAPLAVLLIVLLQPSPNREMPSPPKGDDPKQERTERTPPPPPAAPPIASAPFDADGARRHLSNWAHYLKRPIVETNSIGMKLRLIPPGEFDQGATPAELRPLLLTLTEGEGNNFLRAVPKHRVRLTRPFYMGAQEVTVGQWRAFVQDTQFRTRAEASGEGAAAWDEALKKWASQPGRSWENPGWTQTDNHPVTCICWYDAAAFCAWLSRKEGRIYRLPTEAEWEYACRAGTTTPFHYGDKADKGLAVVGRGASGKTEPVGSYPANAFGLVDMHGNVMEWCSDWYMAYREEVQTNPRGPLTGKERVMRGGPYDILPNRCRSDSRIHRFPHHRSTSMGFRVVCEIPDEKPNDAAAFFSLLTGKEREWTTSYNPNRIKERFTTVTEDGEPALRSPGTGRMKIKYQGSPVEYYHLRLEVKLAPQDQAQPMATIDVQDTGASGLVLQLDTKPPLVKLWQWGSMRFDEAVVKKGQLEVRQKGLKVLSLSQAALKGPGQWDVVDIFSLGQQTVYRINGQVVGAVANLREVNADGKENPVERGGINLGAAVGTTCFRRIEIRPILGLPFDLPDGP